MSRVDRASRVVDATPAQVYAAFVDPDAIVRWLPPDGSSASVERFDARPGGAFRLVLTFDAGEDAAGKSTPDTDVVDATFVEVVPDERVSFEVRFDSDDPAFHGTMEMTWRVAPADEGALVEFVAEDVPPGISAEDHAAGLASSLDHLERYVTT